MSCTILYWWSHNIPYAGKCVWIWNSKPFVKIKITNIIVQLCLYCRKTHESTRCCYIISSGEILFLQAQMGHYMHLWKSHYLPLIEISEPIGYKCRFIQAKKVRAMYVVITPEEKVKIAKYRHDDPLIAFWIELLCHSSTLTKHGNKLITLLGLVSTNTGW